MRILSITAQKPHSTGSGTYLTELVRAFSRLGHEQSVVCGIFPDDTVSLPEEVMCHPVYFTYREKKCSGDVQFPDSPEVSFPVVGMSDIMPYESTLYRDLTPEMIAEFESAFTAAAEDAVRELNPDLIICHHLFLLAAIIRKHIPDIPVIGICHGTDLRQMKNCDNLRYLVRPEIAKLDSICVLHSAQREQAIEIFGIPDDETDKVRIIGSGYNPGLFNTIGRTERAEGSPVRLCYVGKMSAPKGVPELLSALGKLSDNHDIPDFTVTLAGGCRDDDVQAMLNNLPENISWVGQVPQEQVAEIFRSSDIFILPSYFEGLPLVVIEAMACGCIPVATDLAGVRDWIDSNVKNPNVRYIPVPEMASIDAPTDAGRDAFTSDLERIIGDAICDVYTGNAGAADSALPDLSGITWDALASSLIRF